MGGIDANKTMAHLMREHPGLARMLALKGIDCGECLASEVDTLSDVARMYGLDLAKLIQEIQWADDGQVSEET
ncbi:hypothetical protein SIID45300_00610 [Candidatus Magnetaquicoccaceae bacterium FCR-1]|uniref:DUF1858 domain-containing protein n=1 Tax=Candidatus Magnetaquiglobus chichijimensis TaxID=3141448 RepID=A0ABQ0C5Y6_9PROT